MGTSSNGNGHNNGNGSRPNLELLGAPNWFCKAFMHHDERISALEEVVRNDATRKGRKWGAIAGSFMAVFVSTAMSQCHPFDSLKPGTNQKQ